jgi:hypothetical protein
MPIDYTTYHPDFKKVSKWIREVRSGGKCEEDGCNAVNYQPHPITGSKVVLTVAHLDHDKTHADPARLKAMCQRCHLKYDLPRHISNRKYGRKHKEGHQIKLL